MFGFVNASKPVGPTSHDVVARVRRMLPRRTRVGHAGTLDPFASGVLVLCIGPATRLAEYVQRAPKRYRAVVRLGAVSSTGDRHGELARTAGAQPPSQAALATVLARFVGEIEQVPPAHSAVKVAGRRAYKLARRGEEFALAPRTVTVHGLDAIRYEWPELEIDVRCGSGTYIRALARDLGAALGVGGYCDALERTAVGAFVIEDAVAAGDVDFARDLQTPLTALAGLPRVEASAQEVVALRYGQPIERDGLPAGTEAAVTDPGGKLVAVCRIAGDRRLKPAKVFPAAQP